MAETAIELRDLDLSLGRGAARVHILRNISLAVTRGEAVGLVGPSGSGKSTLLMTMAGLERPDRGSIKIDGVSLEGLSEDALAKFRGARIGIVFQAFHLIPTMTALEIVAIPLELVGAADGLARYDWAVPAGADALIVELGANDMLRGLDPAAAKASLAAILARARAAHVATLLTGMRAAPNMGPDYQARFDAIYPDLAKNFGVALYPFFLEGVAADPKLNQKDGLHPTREGVEKIVANILPAVEALLAEAER